MIHTLKRLHSSPIILPKFFATIQKCSIENADILEHVYSQFDEAIYHLNLLKYNKISDNLYVLFRKCHSVLKFTIPLIRDNGTCIGIEAYRAQHQYYNLPCYGGVRISPEVSLDTMEALAISDSIKSGCHGIPFGGSKGGIKIDPQNFSESELKRIYKGYVGKLVKYNSMHSGFDVLGPCMGSSQHEMGWLHDAYITLRKHKDPNYESAVIGKDPNRGGIRGFYEATGFGISVGVKYYLLKNEFCNYFGIPIGINRKTVVIQGYGDVGNFTHKYLQEIGCKVIGIIEKSSGIFCKEGIDFKKLNEHWIKHNTFEGIKDYEVMNNDKAQTLLNLPCDILVLAAAEGVINSQNVKDIRARMIIEGADAPVSYIAQKYLEDKHVPIIPDVLINAANLIASYTEWLKGKDNRQSDLYGHTMSKLAAKYPNIKYKGLDPLSQNERIALEIAIEDIMTRACSTILKYALRHRVRIRLAAHAIAIEKIVRSYYECGIIY